MVVVFFIAMFLWMSVMTYFLLKLSSNSKRHERALLDMVSKVRGLKLAVRVLGARLHSDPD